jgi:serine phosphatase RsbU (regulator of sigma subunit)
MCYCNAGHNPPFLVTDAGTTRLETGGTVLGLFQDGQYETGVASIAAGDMLVMYSDGVTEAENAAGDEFGEQRLIDCLAGARGRSAEQVLAHIQHVLATFTENAAQNDDVTMMAVKVR